MLEKLRELFLKHTAELLGGLLTLLFGTIFWQMLPLILSPLWIRLSPQSLQRILGLSFLSVVALLAYVVLLHRKLKSKLRFQLGIFWDKQANPFCPGCQTPLTNYFEEAVVGFRFKCFKCKERVFIRNDEGLTVPLPQAKQAVLAPRA